MIIVNRVRILLRCVPKIRRTFFPGSLLTFRHPYAGCPHPAAGSTAACRENCGRFNSPHGNGLRQCHRGSVCYHAEPSAHSFSYPCTRERRRDGGIPPYDFTKWFVPSKRGLHATSAIPSFKHPTTIMSYAGRGIMMKSSNTSKTIPPNGLTTNSTLRTGRNTHEPLFYQNPRFAGAVHPRRTA